MSIQEKLTNWWAHRRNGPDMPVTLGQHKNPVLHAQEMQEYLECLIQIRNEAERQRVKVQATLRTLQLGRHVSWSGNDYQDVPDLFSLAHVLEFVLSLGKTKLRLIHLNIAVLQRFKREHPEMFKTLPCRANEGEAS